MPGALCSFVTNKNVRLAGEMAYLVKVLATKFDLEPTEKGRNQFLKASSPQSIYASHIHEHQII